ncbi:MAG: dipeptide epimerase [Actinomycetota bacterium]|nr:dipeptide epimerase [Actinomycetota bacterium]
MPDPKWEVEAKVKDIPLAERFVIARESWTIAENVFVVVRYNGEVGVGECSPSARWEESVESVRLQIKTLDLKLMSSPFELEMLSFLMPPGSARCAVDIAMHDLAAKLAGVSVAQLLGIEDNRPSTSITIPIAPVRSMVQRAMRYSDHPTLKMKVGFDGDVEAVRAVRKVFTGAIRIDANEGWTVDEAVSRLRQLEPLNIELCEQPIPSDNYEDLRFVSACSSIPVFADEDVGTARDVARLAGLVDGVNLKLRKAGGIRETVKAIAVARAHGMKVMLGCDLESGIGATAGAHVAGLVDYMDLDGPLLLADDPFPGVTYRRGTVTLPPGPGLGIKKVPL